MNLHVSFFKTKHAPIVKESLLQLSMKMSVDADSLACCSKWKRSHLSSLEEDPQETLWNQTTVVQ